MKSLLVCCVMLLSLTMTAQNQEKVGEDRNGTYVITSNLDLLKPAWDKLAKQAVTNYSIISATSDGVRVYYLLGTTANNETKISVGLDYRNGVFYKFAATEGSGIESTCTCSGCLSVGCDPRWLPATRVWVCERGCVSCKKTVTATVKNFSSSFTE